MKTAIVAHALSSGMTAGQIANVAYDFWMGSGERTQARLEALVNYYVDVYFGSYAFPETREDAIKLALKRAEWLGRLS